MESLKTPKVLTELQNSFLKTFFELTQDFYLTGGTALAEFYLRHRYSEDLDFFTQNDEDFEHADQIVIQTSSRLKIDFVPVRVTTYFKHFEVGAENARLTLHFARDYADHLKPPKVFNKIIVDSIEDITANKICAALGRTEIKYLIDLYFLDKEGYTISEHFEPAQQKDAGLSSETLAFTLSQFRLSTIPTFMIKPLSLDPLKQYLETTIDWLVEESTPPLR